MRLQEMLTPYEQPRLVSEGSTLTTDENMPNDERLRTACCDAVNDLKVIIHMLPFQHAESQTLTLYSKRLALFTLQVHFQSDSVLRDFYIFVLFDNCPFDIFFENHTALFHNTAASCIFAHTSGKNRICRQF